jgi:hypothetical protein
VVPQKLGTCAPAMEVMNSTDASKVRSLDFMDSLLFEL